MTVTEMRQYYIDYLNTKINRVVEQRLKCLETIDDMQRDINKLVKEEDDLCMILNLVAKS